MQTFAFNLIAVLIFWTNCYVRAETVAILPSKDNTIFEDASENTCGGGNTLTVGSTSTSSLRRSLIQFDIAGAIPAGAKITSASLTITFEGVVDQTSVVSIHMSTKDWGEGTADCGSNDRGVPASRGDATWLSAEHQRVYWTFPGGGYLNTASASTAFLMRNTNATFESTARMVAQTQAWLDAPMRNNGWMLIGVEDRASTIHRFYSRENGVGAPTLTVVYDFTPVTTDAPVDRETSSSSRYSTLNAGLIFPLVFLFSQLSF